MNAERRVQRVRVALAPPGEARPDWEVLCELARAMGQQEGFEFQSAEAVWDEVRQLWPDGAGLSHARLEAGGLQWPCRDETDPGTTLLHVDRFGASERATLRVLPFRPSAEDCSPDFPFLLITGRNLYQFNAGTMSRTSAVQPLRPTDTLDCNPADAQDLGLSGGQLVRVSSRYGAAVLPLRIDDRVQSGHLFATFHDPAVQLNALTSSFRDSVVMAPEYKRTAVRLEAAELAGGCS